MRTVGLLVALFWGHALLAQRVGAQVPPSLYVAECVASPVVAPGQLFFAESWFTCVQDSCLFYGSMRLSRPWSGMQTFEMRTVPGGSRGYLALADPVPDTAAAGEVEVISEILWNRPEATGCRTTFTIVHVFDTPEVKRGSGGVEVRCSVLVDTVTSGALIRRGPDGKWIDVANWGRPPGPGVVTCVDPDAAPGEVRDYRVAARFAGQPAMSPIAHLDPAPGPSAAPWLLGASHARGRLTLRLAPMRTSVLQVDIFDLAGRRACEPVRVDPSSGATVEVPRALGRGTYFVSARDLASARRLKLVVTQP